MGSNLSRKRIDECSRRLASAHIWVLPTGCATRFRSQVELAAEQSFLLSSLHMAEVFLLFEQKKARALDELKRHLS